MAKLVDASDSKSDAARRAGSSPALGTRITMKITTPCVGRCRIENDVCVGCRRTAEQITSWIDYTEDHRKQVIEDLKKQRANSE